MKLVVQPDAREHIDSCGGSVYVWSRGTRCCRGRTFVLETATSGPTAIRLHAYWNGQAWIG